MNLTQTARNVERSRRKRDRHARLSSRFRPLVFIHVYKFTVCFCPLSSYFSPAHSVTARRLPKPSQVSSSMKCMKNYLRRRLKKNKNKKNKNEKRTKTRIGSLHPVNHEGHEIIRATQTLSKTRRRKSNLLSAPHAH